MRTKGFFWHIHHDVLCEWSDDINGRMTYIKEAKPKEEMALRLKLLKPVKGKLPIMFVKVGEACDKAWEAYNKAREAYAKAWEARAKAKKACDKAREAYNKAWEAYAKVMEACDKAWITYGKEIEALHKKECPDCTWNGRTILQHNKEATQG